MATRKRSRAVFTSRDEEVLLSVYRYRLLSVSQIEQLHFISAQTAARRIRLLAARGYLTVTQVPGAPDRIVTIGPKGVAVVAGALDVPHEAVRRTIARPPRDHYFVRHRLMVADFRIALDAACRSREDLSLLGFLDDAICRRTPTGGMERYLRGVVANSTAPDRTLSRIPDGVFALARSGRAALFMHEADRGTEPVTNPKRGIVRVMCFYLGYLAATDYQRYREDFHVAEPFRGFRVLFVTTSAARIDNIRRAAAALTSEPAGHKRFIWLAEAGAVTPESVLGPIWVSLDTADDTRYALVPQSDSGGAG